MFWKHFKNHSKHREFKYIFDKTRGGGGGKIVAGSELSLVSGNYHEPEEPYGVILASAKAEIHHVFADTFFAEQVLQ
jgi:hypothetical protein